MFSVVDLFAGPGGMAEGFSSICMGGERLFNIRLSIEKDCLAFETLRLRSFYRQFRKGIVPDDYYKFIRGDIKFQELYERWPEEAARAFDETWKITLGSHDHSEVDGRISQAVSGDDDWILIGGPPCQAYSSAGRVGNRTRKDYVPENDKRYYLYREFIRAVAVHRPAIFVMENVPGMLTAKLEGKRQIEEVLRGLMMPGDFLYREFGLWPDAPMYRLVSLNSGIQGMGCDPRSFLIHSEEYGIPQARHRVIIIGVREDLDLADIHLPSKGSVISSSIVLSSLPKLRSKLSRELDSAESWQSIFLKVSEQPWLNEVEKLHGRGLVEEILMNASKAACSPLESSGAEYMEGHFSPDWKRSWYIDGKLEGVIHHEARPHIREDLYRYLFCACFGKLKGNSPKLTDFPLSLLPKHQNALSGNFKDRFRVIVPEQPSGTIISHLAKDGHAFIHPDPEQCRSLTPREAARLQTFPDNYYFHGGRAAQFKQIGNAVPPLLARTIAKTLLKILVRQKILLKTNKGQDGSYGLQT